ncbi:MAG: methyl-coenzyme M reductase operon protein D [Methanobrevibacter sp.]|jgi:methyl-coenzyme M reductase subunit D|nr:methyl-coenzyme M reductase operon protein D [Candidatus Methanovirga australis]
MDEIKVIDIKIFPYRRLKPETTEKILNKILEKKKIFRIIIHGESLPKIIGFGPARGTKVNHPDRKVIKVKKEELELFVSVGVIIITVDIEEVNLFLKDLDVILSKTLNFKYEILVGIFTKTSTTVSDYLKYGLGFEQNIDPRMIGLVDPNARSKETVKLINGD